jgi:hypothetical protein
MKHCISNIEMIIFKVLRFASRVIDKFLKKSMPIRRALLRKSDSINIYMSYGPFQMYEWSFMPVRT